MTAARSALLAAAALLALAACGDERGGKSKPRAAPLGFELAMAAVSGARADAARLLWPS